MNLRKTRRSGALYDLAARDPEGLGGGAEGQGRLRGGAWTELGRIVQREGLAEALYLCSATLLVGGSEKAPARARAFYL